jgi:hypothetical protein
MADAFTDTRLQLHWAAQVASAVGTTYAEKHPLWHHVALRWDPTRRALVSAPTARSGHAGLRGGLDVAGRRLMLLDGEDVRDAFDLDGLTFTQAVDWMTAAVRLAGLDEMLQVRDPAKMPDHPVGHGATLRLDAAAADELAALFDQAHRVLLRHTHRHRDAQRILVWSHHFDMASLRIVVPGTKADAEDARTVGVGMTPGDAGNAEPYWYATPWPYPPAGTPLPELEAGEWNTQGWIGAVHPARGASDEDLETFVRAADAACEALIA